MNVFFFNSTNLKRGIECFYSFCVECELLQAEAANETRKLLKDKCSSKGCKINQQKLGFGKPKEKKVKSIFKRLRKCVKLTSGSTDPTCRKEAAFSDKTIWIS